MSITSIHPMQLGPMKNLVYIIHDINTNEAAIVDPAWDLNEIFKTLKLIQAKIKTVLITHGHFDHVNKTEELTMQHNIPVILSHKTILKNKFKKNNQVKDNDHIYVGKTKIMVVETPGHSPDGLCFIINNEAIISGDTLFINGCGRCDLDHSNPKEMYQSLEKIKKLDKNLVVYPGHHYSKKSTSTLKEQIKYNPYLKCKDYDSFFKLRMK